jgi:hypothetical protein
VGAGAARGCRAGCGIDVPAREAPADGGVGDVGDGLEGISGIEVILGASFGAAAWAAALVIAAAGGGNGWCDERGNCVD